MDWTVWLPDHPLGWGVVLVLVLGLGWWGWWRASFLLFSTFGAERLARERNWLFRHGDEDFGDYPTAEQADWDRFPPPPGSVFELLGDVHGFVFHVREQRYRHRGLALRTSRSDWRYSYVITLATTSQPYGGFFTAHRTTAITDWRRALYPAFLAWEQPICHQLNHGAIELPPHGLVGGAGFVSVARRYRRLTRRRLLSDLDLLVRKAHHTAQHR